MTYSKLCKFWHITRLSSPSSLQDIERVQMLSSDWPKCPFCMCSDRSELKFSEKVPTGLKLCSIWRITGLSSPSSSRDRAKNVEFRRGSGLIFCKLGHDYRLVSTTPSEIFLLAIARELLGLERRLRHQIEENFKKIAIFRANMGFGHTTYPKLPPIANR